MYLTTNYYIFRSIQPLSGTPFINVLRKNHLYSFKNIYIKNSDLSLSHMFLPKYRLIVFRNYSFLLDRVGFTTAENPIDISIVS